MARTGRPRHEEQLKDVTIRVRITSDEKMLIDDYCNKNKISISQLILDGIHQIINKK